MTTGNSNNPLTTKTTRRQALRNLGLGGLGLASLGALAGAARGIATISTNNFGDVTGLNEITTNNVITNGFFTNSIATNGVSTNAVPRLSLNSADVATLNFALNLEYLEAEFYSFAVTGTSIESQGINTSGRGTTGNITIKANPAVPFTTPAIQQYAAEIAADEIAHVNFLRAVLIAAGHRPIARPAIDLQNSFAAAANAAGIITTTGTFDPFGDEISFLLGAFFFEDVGVTAYRGATSSITNKTVLSSAAGLMGTEAYHASNIRTKLFESTVGAQQAAQLFSDLRDSLDGTNNDDQGVVVNGAANIVPTDANGLVFARSTRQVLNIVYLAANAKKGGFFPNGVNSSNV